MITEEQIQQMISKLNDYLHKRLEERIRMGYTAIRSQNTVKSYMAHFKCLIYDWMTELNYPMTCADVEKMIAKMEKMGYAPKTIYFVYSMMKNLFHAMGWEWTLRWSDIGVRPRVREAPYLTVEEMKAVLEHVLSKEDAPLRDKAVMCLVTLGMRPYDITMLKAENIIILGDEVIIEYVPCKRGAPTKRYLDKTRSQVILKWIDFLIRALPDRVEETGFEHRIPLQPDTYLFPRYVVDRGRLLAATSAGIAPSRKSTSQLKPLTTATIYLIVRKYCREALKAPPKRALARLTREGSSYRGSQITAYCPYGFRRGVITAALSIKKVPAADLAKLLGLKSLPTVLVYGKREFRDIEDELKALILAEEGQRDS